MGVVRKAEVCTGKKKKKNRLSNSLAFMVHLNRCTMNKKMHQLHKPQSLSLSVRPAGDETLLQKVSSDNVQSFGFYGPVQGSEKEQSGSSRDPFSTEDHLDHKV